MESEGRKRKRQEFFVPVEGFLEEVETAACVFETIPAEKSLRVKGEVYATEAGVLRKWDGKQRAALAARARGLQMSSVVLRPKTGPDVSVALELARHCGFLRNMIEDLGEAIGPVCAWRPWTTPRRHRGLEDA